MALLVRLLGLELAVGAGVLERLHLLEVVVAVEVVVLPLRQLVAVVAAVVVAGGALLQMVQKALAQSVLLKLASVAAVEVGVCRLKVLAGLVH